MDHRAEAREIVQKIIEAERMGGGFRNYHDNAVNQIEALLVERHQLAARCAELTARLKAVDELQKQTVQR